MRGALTFLTVFLLSAASLPAVTNPTPVVSSADSVTVSDPGSTITFWKSQTALTGNQITAAEALIALSPSDARIIALATDNGAASINYIDAAGVSDFASTARAIGSDTLTMVKTTGAAGAPTSGTFNPGLTEDDNVVIQAKGFLYIPAGTWTLTVKSDDANRLIVGGGATVVTEYDAPRSAAYGNNQGGVIDSVITVTVSGYYPYELIGVQDGGNTVLQLTSVSGSHPQPTNGGNGSLPAGSVLVGDTANGGLAVYQNMTNTYSAASGTQVETNTIGLVADAVTIVKTNGGTLVLAPSAGTTNVYSGDTLVRGGALEGVDGVGLSAASNLVLDGGVYQGSGTFSRAVGTNAGEVSWGADGGGFSARGGTLDVALGGGTGQVTWGSGGFVPAGSALLFGSAQADSLVRFENDVDLGGAARTVLVTAGAGGDAAEMSGVLSDGALQVGDGSHGGILILTGANTYSGGTSVSGGTLVVANTSGSGTGSGAVDVLAGTLRGTGTVGAVSVYAGGTLAAGTAAATGVLTVNGNLSLASGSTTTLRLNGTSAGTGYDQIRVGGTAAFGGTLDLDFGFVPTVGQSFTLFDASAYSGAFGTIDPSLSLRYSFADGVLTILGFRTSFVPYALTPNQKAVAAALDTVLDDSRAQSLVSSLDGVADNQLPAAFDQISPQPLLAVPQILFGNTRAALGDIDQHLSDLRAGVTGLSLSQLNFFDGQIPLNALIAGSDALPPSGVKAFRPTPDNPWSFFLSGGGDFGQMEPGGEAARSTFSGGRFTAGADYRLSRETVAGLYAGYDGTDAKLGGGSGADDDAARFGAYGSWKDAGGDWLGASFGGAYHWLDTSRAAYGGTASGQTGGTELNGSLRYGHDFPCGPWTITPTAALTYASLNFGAYDESGSLAPLSIREESASSCRSELGWTVQREFLVRGVRLRPYVRAGWEHEFLDTGQALTAHLASGAGAPFTVTANSLGQESASFGAGISATFTESLSGQLSYAGEAGNRFQDHTLSAALRVLF